MGLEQWLEKVVKPDIIGREKKELYRQQEIDEYWIVDLKGKKVEIYELDYDETGTPQYYLWKIITEENKGELKLIHFPNVKITFDEPIRAITKGQSVVLYDGDVVLGGGCIIETGLLQTYN